MVLLTSAPLEGLLSEEVGGVEARVQGVPEGLPAGAEREETFFWLDLRLLLDVLVRGLVELGLVFDVVEDVLDGLCEVVLAVLDFDVVTFDLEVPEVVVLGLFTLVELD